ncbi:tripartite tricarboxylate transporter TctB family protein [Neorhizobium sp. LjRoot104]|uniref:tripartite tricarboxylate transporter TctB family protein n=1 Tax=Neorhizobium sp. LjRoot104 TaxID=3342254 RepID=UPI003ECF94F2
MKKQINTSDLVSGAVFLGVGVLYGVTAYETLPMGEALSMGPGYFPAILSGLLALLGTVMIGRSFHTVQSIEFGKIPHRAIAFITAAILIFANLLDELGLPLCVFVTSFLAFFGKREANPLRGGIIALGIAIFCTAIFGFGIRLPIPIVGTWIGGQ